MKGCRPLGRAEIARILGRVRGRYAARDRALFTLMLLSGYRVSEALSLRVGDVLTGKAMPKVIVVHRRSMKGKTSSRGIVFHPAARAAVLEWLKVLRRMGRLQSDGPLFCSRQGQRAITRAHAWEIFKRAADGAGVVGATGLHSLRKTFAATAFSASGRDLLLTSKVLGHARIESTQHYLATSQSQIDRIVLGMRLPKQRH